MELEKFFVEKYKELEQLYKEEMEKNLKLIEENNKLNEELLIEQSKWQGMFRLLKDRMTIRNSIESLHYNISIKPIYTYDEEELFNKVVKYFDLKLPNEE